ncbi:Integrase catalytic region [Denitrovibrio acetiphilus DSM 12809]|uniref:Integrase catalytic region n=1 Tax=Denitrovibrio acetiphilus (strain DSM 12809 / NBRC 114555 / N2460) TaxID=522772 RepID=D4H2L1_DENA2|nr:IS21 family transposase [Denitrovibrio acetiphilus]ADD67072.1 Integrase catalytic region [Denitrovibrio acetiphilus DSM 12809]
MTRLTMSEIKEVIRLRYINQLSIRQISVSTGIPKSTVSDYVNRFRITGLKAEELSSVSEDELYSRLFPERSMPLKRTFPMPDLDYIAREKRRKGVTWLLLWQEYKSVHPDGYNYTQFKEYCKKHISRLSPTMRQIYNAGEIMFVDYSGLTMDIVDRYTGEVSEAQIFVSALGASGAVFVHATESQKKESFILSHSLAFEYYGAVSKTVVPDNLKSAITKHTRDVLTVNSSYSDMAKYYGCAVIPARPAKPQDKAKVEQAVQGIQRWILAKLRNRLFNTVQELNSAISPLTEVYNNKVIRGIGKSRLELLDEIDRPEMLSLPKERYQYREYLIRHVGFDYHVDVSGSRYSVPYKLIKNKVDVWHSATTVEIYHKGDPIAIHPKSKRGSTLTEHMPPNHVMWQEKWNPTRILNWAGSIGLDTARLMKNILDSRSHPANAYRTCIAILSRAKNHDKNDFNMACKKAVEIRAYSVKSLESILSSKIYLEKNDKNTAPLSNHNNVRGRDYYKEEDKCQS